MKSASSLHSIMELHGPGTSVTQVRFLVEALLKVESLSIFLKFYDDSSICIGMNQKMSRSEAGKLGAKISAEIAGRKKEERIREYNENPKICGHCKSVIPYGSAGKKYCSTLCSYLNNKEKVSELNTKHGRFKIKLCKWCNVGKTKGTFCSHECRGKFQKSVSLDKVKRGELSYPTIIKEFLIKNRGHQCEDCKNKEWKCQPINLTIHHVDGDSTNNLPENLQLLCWNCHSMTPNYGSKNKNSSRIQRRNAYVPVTGNGPVS